MAQDPGAGPSPRPNRPDPGTDDYRRVFESSPYPMWVHDLDTLRILAVNAAAVARYGYSREEFLERTVRDIHPADEAELTGRPLEFAGRPARLVMAVDATDARRARETLRWLQRAVEQTDAAVLLTDREGVITYVNPAFERLYGYTLQGAVGQTPRLLKSGAMSADHYASLWHTLLAGRNYRGTHINRSREGERVVVEASVTPLRGAADEIVGYVSIHHDITERRRLEEKREQLEAQLAHAQRFEALGALAADMARDFENLIEVVLGQAAQLASAPGDPGVVSHAAAALRLAGESGTSQVQRILAFARRADARFQVGDAVAIASDPERLLQAPAPEEAAAPAPAPAGVVLLVEDDELVAEVGRAWLEDAGYRVLSAGAGDEALRVFSEDQGQTHVVVCDLGLPVIPGRDVFYALRRMAPQLPVVLVSGFFDPAERVELAQAGAAGFLEKPYREGQLIETVARARERRDV